ncbi:terminase gpA endonuclease subunit [Kaustia mangrovi]|uniref:terminase gpA endonuclease subunit n=1 Tax=Kaustia mangrovi TaxID=2593653 RepID=UPI0031B5B566
MLENGEWRAENPGAGGTVHGYHLSSLYSPVGWLSWGEIAEMWVDAQGDTEKLRVFVNTVLGETFHDRGDAPDWKTLYDRREGYEIGTVPEPVCVLTAGVDVQKDRLVYEVDGWGPGKENWSIEADVIPGDPAVAETWKQLDALLEREFEHESGTPMRIAMLAVDANTWTSLVLPWARKKPMNRVMAIRTQPRQNTMVEAPRKIDVTVRGTKMKRGYKYWPIGAHLMKTELYGWLRLEAPTDDEEFPAGYCHFPQYGETYFKEITAEQLVAQKTKGGFVSLEWQLISGRENHYLDCRVYARAAAAVVGIDRWREDDWRRVEIRSVKAEAPNDTSDERDDAKPDRKRDRRDGWLRGRKGWLNRRR